jgi:hypothetical protein
MKNLLIPQFLKVGFQERAGTYTNKLGFIIYKKGKVWAQEKSWEGWRHKPDTILNDYHPETRSYTKRLVEGVEPIEFENVPIEGWVLNKKAGGTSSGWNKRNTYARVWDPRGWEFEITLDNLLFILECTDCVMGKGLIGEFVYSWDGKNIVLLPKNTPDWEACQEYTSLKTKKFNPNKMILGKTYLNSRSEKIVFLGKREVFKSEPSSISKEKWYEIYNSPENSEDRLESPESLWNWQMGVLELANKIKAEIHSWYKNNYWEDAHKISYYEIQSNPSLKWCFWNEDSNKIEVTDGCNFVKKELDIEAVKDFTLFDELLETYLKGTNYNNYWAYKSSLNPLTDFKLSEPIFLNDEGHFVYNKEYNYYYNYNMAWAYLNDSKKVILEYYYTNLYKIYFKTDTGWLMQTVGSKDKIIFDKSGLQFYQKLEII